MREIIIVILGVVLFFSEASCMKRSMSRTPANRILEKPVADYYRGNPLTDKSSLYIYLCRRGVGIEQENCYCSHCSGNTQGLCLGFICVDERDNEFNGIGPDTDNLLWSMHAVFQAGQEEESCCRASGDLKARYCYNPAVYYYIEPLNDRNEVLENPDFLHNTNGDRCEIAVLDGVVGSDGGTKELSVRKILRTALFRVKFPGEGITSLSQALGLLGSLGEKKQVKNKGDTQIIVPYSYLGIGGNNCATFCRSALGELAAFPVFRMRFKPVVTVAAFASGAASGAMIGSGFCPGVGTAVGAGVGVAAEAALIAVSALIKRVKANDPESVIDMTLDFFSEKYENGDEDIQQIIDQYFAVMAHGRERDCTSSQIDLRNYDGFELKRISDVISSRVRIKNTHKAIFFKEDFVERSETKKGGCILL